MSCGCNEDPGTGGNPTVSGTQQPVTRIQYPANHFVCSCGCNELRERVALLESSLYQLTLIVQNREKAEGNPQPPRRRFIGDKLPDA